MTFLKRLLTFLIISGILLIPFNYFFAHFAFNNVVNKFAQSQVPKGQHLAFSSSFHFYPSMFIRFQDVDYEASKDSKLQIKELNAYIDFWPLIKQKQLHIKSFDVNDVILTLGAKSFDEFIKEMVFPLIREGLGVPRDPSIVFPSRFSIKRVVLNRVSSIGAKEAFSISDVKYNSDVIGFMKMCFADVQNTNAFYDRFIKQFLFAASVEGNCIVFKKSMSPIQIPNLPAPKDN